MWPFFHKIIVTGTDYLSNLLVILLQFIVNTILSSVPSLCLGLMPGDLERRDAVFVKDIVFHSSGIFPVFQDSLHMNISNSEIVCQPFNKS